MTLLGLIGASAPAHAKFPGPNGAILFTRFDPAVGDGVLYTMNPDGSDQQQIEPFGVECPLWSPDGSLIATCGAPDGGTSLIINPDDGTYREIYASDPSLFLACNVWSPDAKRLACDQFQSAADPSRDGIYTVRTSDGTVVQRITKNSGGEDRPFDYSPSGNQIVFGRVDPARPSSTNQAVFVVNLDGSGLRRISPWVSRGFDMSAGWSPDGKTILFSSNGSLFRVHPDGTGLAKIVLAGVRSSAFAFQPGWSPDGTKIVFAMFTGTSPGTGQEGVYTANADGSDVLQLTNSPTHDDSQDWGPHTPTA